MPTTPKNCKRCGKFCRQTRGGSSYPYHHDDGSLKRIDLCVNCADRPEVQNYGGWHMISEDEFRFYTEHPNGSIVVDKNSDGTYTATANPGE